MFAGGGAEGFALLGLEHLVDAELGGIHFAVDGGLQFGLAVEERVKLLRLVTFTVHEHHNAVVHGMLLLAQGGDTLARFVADVLHFAFLHGVEVLNNLGNVAVFPVLTVAFVLGREGQREEHQQEYEGYLFHGYVLFFVKVFVRVGGLLDGSPRGVVVELGQRAAHAFDIVGAGVDGGEVDGQQHDDGSGGHSADARPKLAAAMSHGLQVGALADLLHHAVGDVDLLGVLQVR